MIQWKDVSSWSRTETDRSEPKSWEAKIGVFRLTVHRHIHYPPDTWLASCQPDVFDKLELRSKKIDEAKGEAVAKLKVICADALKAIGQ